MDIRQNKTAYLLTLTGRYVLHVTNWNEDIGSNGEIFTSLPFEVMPPEHEPVTFLEVKAPLFQLPIPLDWKNDFVGKLELVLIGDVIETAVLFEKIAIVLVDRD